MASPTYIGGTHNNLASGSYTQSSPGTIQVGDTLLVCLGTRNNAGVILGSAITATGFGSFQRITNGITDVSVSYPNAPGQFSTFDLGLDIWWARATSASAGGQTVNITLSGTPGQVDTMIALFRGTFDPTSPFDSQPFAKNNANGTTTVTYSTTQADDMLVFVAYSNSASASGNPAGWSVQLGVSGDPDAMLCTKSVSAAQTSQTAATTGAWGHVAAVVALTADAKATAAYQTIVVCCS